MKTGTVRQKIDFAWEIVAALACYAAAIIILAFGLGVSISTIDDLVNPPALTSSVADEEYVITPADRARYYERYHDALVRCRMLPGLTESGVQECARNITALYYAAGE